MSIHYVAILEGAALLASPLAAGTAAWIAQRAYRTGERLAASTDTQAQATEAAATAAKESAVSAAASNSIAETLEEIELTRLHREMYPNVSVDFQWEPSSRMPGQQNLYAYVRNSSEQDYQLHPFSEWGEDGGSSNLTGVTVGAGQTTKIFVTNDGLLLAHTLVLEFDSLDPCLCPRRTSRGHHWRRGFAVPQGAPSSLSGPPRPAILTARPNALE